MNYRHQFHAGNFADVLKHVVLLFLVRGLQRKDKGFLFLDTHAGRGRYDLARAERGDSLARQPEWPDGIGRVLASPAEQRPPAVQSYLDAVRAFGESAAEHPTSQRAADAGLPALRWYPGSPALVGRFLRPQDRMVLCERHPEEHAALVAEAGQRDRTRIELTDGYAALRAHLPPRERRALVLIDPPYEAMDEFDQLEAALGEGLRRMPGGTFAVWYPLTERARVDDFFATLGRRTLPPTLAVELTVVGPDSPQRLKGCGVLILNPPWQLDRELSSTVSWLATTLRRAPGGEGAMRWLVPE